MNSGVPADSELLSVIRQKLAEIGSRFQFPDLVLVQSRHSQLARVLLSIFHVHGILESFELMYSVGAEIVVAKIPDDIDSWIDTETAVAAVFFRLYLADQPEKDFESIVVRVLNEVLHEYDEFAFAYFVLLSQPRETEKVATYGSSPHLVTILQLT